MKFKKMLLWAGATALAGAAATDLSQQNRAYADSSANESNEVVITGTRQAMSVNGLSTQVKDAKDEFVVGQQFIKERLGSANFAQLLDLTPGFSYFSEDATGVLSGDVRIHGLDCAHVSILVDGAPVNDTGNYACYPGEYLPAEVTNKITVNVGATDVDSPTASAVGGTVNVSSKIPDSKMGFSGKAEGGSFSYRRGYVEADSGAIGPTGLRAYLSGNYVFANKWRGEGDIKRKGFDGELYQPLWGKSFVSLAGSYASNRPIFYYTSSFANINQYGYYFDYNKQFAPETATPGVADTVPAPVPSNINPAGADSNFWGLHPNPVNFGTVRGQSLFELGHSVSFTFDPFYFYTIANGGGATAISESDKRLIGSSAATGVDLNGDGDTKDSVLLYTPSNTRTNRWGVNTSLLFDLNPNNRFQFAYNLDWGRHRQTGEDSYINLVTGQPANVFGGIDGPTVHTADGNILRKRDRFSLAKLNQYSVNYLGKFFDDAVHVNIGARAPEFERDLNQYCFVYNGGTEYCDSVALSQVQTALAADNAAHTVTNLNTLLGTAIKINPLTNQPNFRLPFSQTYHFHKVLPNAGVTFKVADSSLFYLSYAQGFSAPKTDDLYTSQPELVRPETSTLYAAGYRYQAGRVNTSLNLWQTDYHNRIVQSVDPNDPTSSIDRNVGTVDLLGIDADIGFRLNDSWNFYLSAEREHTNVKGNEVVAVGGVAVVIPTAGKELVNTPNYTLAERVQYKSGPAMVEVVGKYTGPRFMTDMNDVRSNGYATFDIDASYALSDWLTVRLNALNVLSRRYVDRIATTTTNGVTFVAPGGITVPGSTPFFAVGEPASAVVSLEAKF